MSRIPPLTLIGVSLLFVGTLGCASSRNERSQEERGPSSPARIVEQYFEAMKEGNWVRCAELMHPEALDRFKDILLDITEIDTAGTFLTRFFGDGTTPASFQAMPRQEAFATFTTRVLSREPEYGEILASMAFSLIGHVNETDSLTHVLYRMKLEYSGLTMSEIEVISLKQLESSWGVLLTRDVENMAEAVKQQFIR